MNRERTRKPAFPSGSGDEEFPLPVPAAVDGRMNERGIALVVTLLVMGLLTLLGATFLTIPSTEHTIASNEAGVAKAFNIAEAGLERGKARIKTGTETGLNAFLSGTNPGPNLYTDVAFDDGTYTVVIEDDVGGGGGGSLTVRSLQEVAM